MKYLKIPDTLTSTGMSKTPVYKNDSFQLLHLFIPAGKELKSHISDRDAVIVVLEGEAEFILEDEWKMLHRNDSISFGAGQPHSIKAVTDFSMLLLK